MKILALDTGTPFASAAVTENGRLLASVTVRSGNSHSEILLPAVEEMLRSLRLSPSGIDLFALAVGPGSFTGVRIGASTLKGLAFGSGKPCVGVSSLEAIAENFRGMDGILCPVIDARRDRMYKRSACRAGRRDFPPYARPSAARAGAGGGTFAGAPGKARFPLRRRSGSDGRSFHPSVSRRNASLAAASVGAERRASCRTPLSLGNGGGKGGVYRSHPCARLSPSLSGGAGTHPRFRAARCVTVFPFYYIDFSFFYRSIKP